jgi:hypothetical protein
VTKAPAHLRAATRRCSVTSQCVRASGWVAGHLMQAPAPSRTLLDPAAGRWNNVSAQSHLVESTTSRIEGRLRAALIVSAAVRCRIAAWIRFECDMPDGRRTTTKADLTAVKAKPGQETVRQAIADPRSPLVQHAVAIFGRRQHHGGRHRRAARQAPVRSRGSRRNTTSRRGTAASRDGPGGEPPGDDEADLVAAAGGGLPAKRDAWLDAQGNRRAGR